MVSVLIMRTSAFLSPVRRCHKRVVSSTLTSSSLPSFDTPNEVSPKSSLYLFRTSQHFSSIATLSQSKRQRDQLNRNNDNTRLFLSTSSVTTTESVSSLKGISWIKDCTVQVLNDTFDSKECARVAALAKLEPKKKKKKKKKKKQGDGNEDAVKPSESETTEPQLTQEEKDAIGDAAAAAAASFGVKDAMITPATKAEFGDYQCNAAMGLAKNLGMSPRDCASKIIDGLRPLIGSVIEEPEIAGPGFINLRLNKEYLSQAIYQMANDPERLAVPLSTNKKKIVVDFSSPNIAKEMHVGHLRSTIIGDTLANVLEFSGHDVKRLNHIGDWGTQFGMLVEHLRSEYPAALNVETSQDVDLGDLVMLYKAAKLRFDSDEEFKVRSREGVVKLQAGDEESLAAWESLCAASRKEYQKIYDALNIEGLEERGESFYNPFLNGVIEELEKQSLAVPSDGATAVFLDGYTNRDGSPLPMLVRKSDGGFIYATTDLAAVRHRAEFEDGEKADRILYVTDAGQSQHFEMVFTAAKMASFAPTTVSLEHVPFGLVQGEDGKKFATRSGDTVKLRDLLDEAVRIAGVDIRSRLDDPDAELSSEVQEVVKTVGIGAVKYADLSMNRESNYKFSYDRMLSLNGNTAPYMLYAYARICGIVKKATGHEQGDTMIWPVPSEIIISDDSEAQLIRNLVKLPDILNEVESALYPNRLCDYLFETSQLFNKFYESCPVNNAATPELKASRLSLCTVTAGTIKLLMNILGIKVVERL